MYCGSRPKPPQRPVGNSDQLSPPPIIRSMNINPPHTDAHETKLSRNFATIRGSPLGVRSFLGSFFVVGRVGRRRSAPPAGEILGGPSRVSPRPPPALVLRAGRYGGALRASIARRKASAVGQRASGSVSRERMTHEARSSGQVGVRSLRFGACSVICLRRRPGTVGAENGSSPASI